jgi:hypothetical protein
MSQQHVRMLISVRQRNQISFLDTDMGRQLHPSGRQVYIVRTLSLIRQDVEKNCNRPDASPYYENYVQQKCNRPDVRATLSRRGPDMVLREARYGKPVAQLSVRTLSATVRTSPREIRFRLVLGLLSI